MAHKKVPLTSIKTLTFYSGKSTTARRGKPIPQLSCSGSACKVFQPDVVQCVNMGDDGSGGVQWRCDTDLPSSFRMGKVDVSCEGWSKAGDQNVLQGSCGLTYDLHRVNKGLEYGEDPHGYGHGSSSTFDSFANKAFNLLFYAISGIILYSLARSLLLRFSPRNAPPPLSSFFPPSNGGGGGGGGGGPGFNNSRGGGGGGSAPPPPYSKNPDSDVSQAQVQAQGWNPGFWTGLGAGALGTYLTARSRGDPQSQAQRGYGQGQAQFNNIRTGRRVVDSFDDDDGDRGIGSSRSAGASAGGLGEMRRATGFGGSSTR